MYIIISIINNNSLWRSFPPRIHCVQNTSGETASQWRGKMFIKINTYSKIRVLDTKEEVLSVGDNHHSPLFTKNIYATCNGDPINACDPFTLDWSADRYWIQTDKWRERERQREREIHIYPRTVNRGDAPMTNIDLPQLHEGGVLTPHPGGGRWHLYCYLYNRDMFW